MILKLQIAWLRWKARHGKLTIGDAMKAGMIDPTPKTRGGMGWHPGEDGFKWNPGKLTCAIGGMAYVLYVDPGRLVSALNRANPERRSRLFAESDIGLRLGDWVMSTNDGTGLSKREIATKAAELFNHLDAPLKIAY